MCREELRDRLQETASSPQHDGKNTNALSSVKDAATAASPPGRASGRGDAQDVFKGYGPRVSYHALDIYLQLWELKPRTHPLVAVGLTCVR